MKNGLSFVMFAALGALSCTNDSTEPFNPFSGWDSIVTQNDSSRDQGPVACTDPADCNDQNTCTVDSCDDGKCANIEVSCDDGDPCTLDWCEGGQCQSTAKEICCTLDDECSDGDPCTPDKCESAMCVSYPATSDCCTSDAQCDDNDPCTNDSCSEQNACEHKKIINSSCCEHDKDCLDSNAATIDKCVDGKCENTPVAGKCIDDSDCVGETVCETGVCNENHACEYSAITGCCIEVNDCAAKTCQEEECVANECSWSPIPNCCTTDADCKESCLVCEFPTAEHDEGTCVLSTAPECCTTTVFTEDFLDRDNITVSTLADHDSTPRWVIDTNRSISAPSSLYFGNPADHTFEDGTGVKGGRALLKAINMTGTMSPTLTFNYFKSADIMGSTDVLSVFIVETGTETKVWSTASLANGGNTSDFKLVSLPLSDFLGRTVRIAFEFDTVNAFPTNYEGVYVDDVVISGICE